MHSSGRLWCRLVYSSCTEKATGDKKTTNAIPLRFMIDLNTSQCLFESRQDWLWVRIVYYSTSVLGNRARDSSTWLLLFTCTVDSCLCFLDQIDLLPSISCVVDKSTKLHTGVRPKGTFGKVFLETSDGNRTLRNKDSEQRRQSCYCFVYCELDASGWELYHRNYFCHAFFH